jgi:hypothetical protein
MSGDIQGGYVGRDKLGRYKPGFNSRKATQARIAARAEELRREYFPNGGMSIMDGNRIVLAAKHFITAETCRDHVTAQRATRCAEYLLSKLKPPATRLVSARELLDRLP